MSPLVALFLGLLQGLTEFLPVSSSGHLVLAQRLLGLQENMLFFDIVLHVGTLAAVCLFYWRDLLGLVGVRVPGALATPHTLLLLIAGTIPTGAIALVGRSAFRGAFATVTVPAIALMVTGCILWTTRFPTKRREPEMRLLDALAIGVAQGFAITPGISRSGTTIAAGLWLGLDRDMAARYSFLLAIPAILGAVVLEWEPPAAMGAQTVVAFGIGLCAAAASGYVALQWLVHLIRRGAFWMFAPYCWAVGGLALLALSQVGTGAPTIEVQVQPPPATVRLVAEIGTHAPIR